MRSGCVDSTFFPAYLLCSAKEGPLRDLFCEPANDPFDFQSGFVTHPVG